MSANARSAAGERQEMKKRLLFVLAVLTGMAPGTAQLVITSFSQNGALTWTNVLSNATYRVEWAGSPAGPWLSFDALTNLNSLSATSNAVTVTVPTCYRVVWLDPPPPEPEGVWDYRAYDHLGVLGVTGRLSLVIQTNKFNNLSGTRDLQLTGSSRNSYLSFQRGTGIVLGRLTGHDLYLELDPATADENPVIQGCMIGGYLSGIWAYHGNATGGGEPEGTFVAVKVDAQASASSTPVP